MEADRSGFSDAMEMIRHLWASRRVGAWLDAELRPVAADRVLRHLRNCSICVDVVDELLHLKASLARPSAEHDLVVGRLRERVRAGEFVDH